MNNGTETTHGDIFREAKSISAQVDLIKGYLAILTLLLGLGMLLISLTYVLTRGK